MKGLLKRIERLEAQKPEGIVILAENNGERKEIPVNEMFTENGERRPGFEGWDFVMVVSGNSLEDAELILNHFFCDSVIC